MSAPRQPMIVEAHSGRERQQTLAQFAQQAAGPEEWWSLDCHMDHGGVWAGIRGLFQSVVPAAQADRPDLIRRHDYELVHVLPELRRTIEVRNPTLTDTAPYEEKTRNYPSDRWFRILHGLIDFLDVWRAYSESGRWVLACDHIDHISHAGGVFLREMFRRRGAPWDLMLILGCSPGTGREVSGRLGLDFQRTALQQLELAAEAPPELSADDARVQAEALERMVGEDQVEIQLHLPWLIDLWRQAGDERNVTRWRCWGLEIYNTLGFYEDALTYGDGALEKVESWAPGQVEVLWSIFVKQFMSLAGLGRSQEALDMAMSAYGRGQSTKHQGQLCYLIAMLHGRFLEERDYELAEAYLDEGLKLLEQADLPAHEYHFQCVFNRNGLAMIRTFQKRFEDALTLCKDGLERLEEYLEPEAHRLHRSVLYYNMAQVYAYVGAVPEALENFSAAMEMDPNYSEYYNERGSLLLKSGHPERALRDYERALRLSPPYFELYTNLGHCYCALERFESAIDFYSRSLDLVPDNLVSLVGRAQAAEGLGRNRRALADYNAVIALEPDHWQARAARAVLLYELGEFQASCADLDRAIEQAPDTPALYQNRAIVRADLGLPEQAIADLDRYLRLQPDSVDRVEVEAQMAELHVQAAASERLPSP